MADRTTGYSRDRRSICAALLATALLATPAAAQVVDFGKYPDFKGQWVRTGNPNNWRELGGPPVVPPTQSGYGTNLIRDLIPHEIGGTVDLAFPADGACCKIEFPLAPAGMGPAS